MRAGWVNSGHASKFSQAGRFGGARKHIFVSGAGPISSPEIRALCFAGSWDVRHGRGLRRVDLAPRPGWAGSQTVPVCLVNCRRLQVHARAARFKRPGATSGHSGCDGSDITTAVHAPEQEAAFASPKYPGTFIQGARSRGSQNRRGGDDGTRSLAVADRNSDPDHPADLAVWRPSRVKCALTSSQRAGSLPTAGFALFVYA
jgi:hypothetical protein